MVARSATLDFSGPNTAAVELLGDLPFEYDGERLQVPLGDLFSGEQGRLFLRVMTVPGTSGSRLDLRGELTYVDLSGHMQSASATVTFTYASQEQVMAAPCNRNVQQRTAEIRLSTAAHQALKLEREGRSHEAAELLQEAVRANMADATPNVANDYVELAQRLREKRVSAVYAKSRQFEEYKKRTSRL